MNVNDSFQILRLFESQSIKIADVIDLINKKFFGKISELNFVQIQNVVIAIESLISENVIYIKGDELWLNFKK